MIAQNNLNININMKKKITLITLASAALVITSNAAATMSVSPSAPTVDGEDLNNYGAYNASHKFWAETSGAGLTRGQTFTTGSDAVMLSSFSFTLQDTTQATADKSYNIRLGTITEALGVSSFNSMVDQTVYQSADWTGTASALVDAGDTAAPWATFAFDAPVMLAANTTYGVDLGMYESAGGWRSGIPYLARSSDNGPAGDEFSSGVTSTDPGLGNTDANFGGSRDMIYHLDMAAVPEPSSTALLGLGGLALILRRRK